MTLTEMISSSWLSILCIKGTWHQKHWRKWAGCRAGSWERATAIHGVASQNFSAGFIKTLIAAGKQTPCIPEVKALKTYLLDVLRKKKRQRHPGSITWGENGSWRTPFNLLPSEGCLGQKPYFISVTWKIGWCLCRHLVLHMKASFSIFIMAISMNLLELNGERLCI